MKDREDCKECRQLFTSGRCYECQNEELRERINKLELECSGMGNLLQSGIVIKTDEYTKIQKVIEKARKYSMWQSIMNKQELFSAIRELDK